jgi:hypothetical protein
MDKKEDERMALMANELFNKIKKEEIPFPMAVTALFQLILFITDNFYIGSEDRVEFLIKKLKENNEAYEIIKTKENKND